jgi:hypothetical protein
MDMPTIELMLKNTSLDSNKFVQDKDEILLKSAKHIDICKDYLFDLLDGFEMRLSGHF